VGPALPQKAGDAFRPEAECGGSGRGKSCPDGSTWACWH
jgi:hypothetical protein